MGKPTTVGVTHPANSRNEGRKTIGMALKPVTADVYLVYKCDKCESLYTITRKETIFPGGVLCGCGNELRFEPVKSIRVIPNYTTQRQEEKRVVDSPKIQENHQDVLDSLVGLGYNKGIAKRKIAALLPLKMSNEQMLRKILSEENHG